MAISSFQIHTVAMAVTFLLSIAGAVVVFLDLSASPLVVSNRMFCWCWIPISFSYFTIITILMCVCVRTFINVPVISCIYEWKLLLLHALHCYIVHICDIARPILCVVFSSSSVDIYFNNEANYLLNNFYPITFFYLQREPICIVTGS